MLYYIISIVYFMYCIIDNWMPVATHGHESSIYERAGGHIKPLFQES
jgi:hypothetical protein